MAVTVSSINVVFGQTVMKPLRGFPEGSKVRIRLRHEDFGVAFVRTSEGISKWIIEEKDGHFQPALLQSFNSATTGEFIEHDWTKYVEPVKGRKIERVNPPIKADN